MATISGFATTGGDAAGLVPSLTVFGDGCEPARADYLAHAAHDLLAPVRVIRNLPDWVREDLADAGTPVPDAVDGSLRGIEQQALRLERLVKDMMSFERLAIHDPLPAELCPHTRLCELAEIILPDGPWSIDIIGDMPPLDIDPALFDEIFAALIDNAVKHHPRPHGHVRIDLGRDGADLLLAVSDDGAGIAAAHHARVVRPFQTLVPRDELEGSGMGLARALRAALRLGGRIGLGPGPRGQGTTVRVVLPETLLAQG